MNKEVCEYRKLKYILSLPDGYVENGSHPLLVFLHGAGTRGDDIDRLMKNPFFTETGDKLSKFIVAAPQCNADSWFPISEQLHEFICHMAERMDVDKSRIYLIGVSMGGYGVWQEAMNYPEMYAAIIPICGGGMYWNASRLKNIKVRAFHGACDTVVYPEESKKMVDKVNSCGGDAKLTVYDGVGHDSWMNVYRDNNIFNWLSAQENANIKTDKSPLEDSEIYG